MALVSRKAPQGGKEKKQKIKVNPYEIEGNTLDLIAQIAAARPNDAISEFWNPINDFFFYDDSTKREVVERDDDNEKKVTRPFTFKEYFYKFRGEFYDADFLRVVYNKVETLAREIQSAENTKHTQIVVAGGFSAGKSSFLNRLTGYGELLPTGVEPVSVVSTYLYCSNDIKDVKVQGLNAKNTVVDLDRNILEGIKHSNGSSHHFASVLEKLFVTVPSNSRIDGLAFIDTPGYDNSVSANASNGKTDRETAEASLAEGQILIWLVDAEKGALRKEDIAMIGTFEGPKFIVFNKADKKGRECKAIVETAYSELSKALGEENNVVDVLAYSTSEDKLYYSVAGFSSIDEILKDIKDNAANGLSHRNEIIDEIKTMFNDEIDWSESSIKYYSERYKEALDDKKKWVDCLESWENAEKEEKDWAKEVIVKTYDGIISSADDLTDLSSKLLDNYRDLINDSWGYINGKLSSSESLERILNYYGGKFDGFVDTYNNAIKYTYYKPESRKNLLSKFNEYYDWRVDRIKGWLEDSKDRTNAQLDTKISCEKRMNDMTNFKKRFLDAVKLGIDSYEAKKRSASVKVSLNGEDNESVDVFTAIDKDDMTQFIKCFVNGVDNVVCNADGYSPLTYAVKSGNNAMVKFLIDHDADYSALDGRGYNAFHTAVENQYKDICEILLNIDSDLVDSKTKNDETVSDLLEKNTFKNWLNSKI